MAWDYSYQISADGGSTFVTVSDYCTFVRIDETGASTRYRGPTALHRPGTVEPDYYYPTPTTYTIEFRPRYTDSAGAVTDGDGAAGHVFENLAKMKELLSGGWRNEGVLRRTAPHHGAMDLEFVVSRPVRETGTRTVFAATLRALWPFWKDTVQLTNQSAAGTVTVNGDAPVHDATLRIIGGTDAKVTHDGSGAYLQYSGAPAAGGVNINCKTGAVTNVTGGADVSDDLRWNKPFLMVLDPGANTFTITGSPSTAEFDFYDQWQ